MILNYPNSTDNNFDLYKYLIENINSTINYINLNLDDDIIIENNIFGYIFLGIDIINLEKYENLIFFSSNENQIIFSNYTIEKNEIIKFNFLGLNYNAFNCNIIYRYKVTEPNSTIYDDYAEIASGNAEMPLIKEEYFGRLSYYNIYLNESLSTNCKYINCALCLDKNRSFCIVIKYDFIFDNNFTNFEYVKDEKTTELENVEKTTLFQKIISISKNKIIFN